MTSPVTPKQYTAPVDQYIPQCGFQCTIVETLPPYVSFNAATGSLSVSVGAGEFDREMLHGVTQTYTLQCKSPTSTQPGGSNSK